MASRQRVHFMVVVLVPLELHATSASGQQQLPAVRSLAYGNYNKRQEDKL